MMNVCNKILTECVFIMVVHENILVIFGQQILTELGKKFSQTTIMKLLTDQSESQHTAQEA